MTRFGVPGQNNNPAAYADFRRTVLPMVQAPKRPSVNDKKFALFTIWRTNRFFSGAEGEIWILTRYESNGDATWIMLGGGVGVVTDLRADDGNVVVPLAGIIDVDGLIVDNAANAKPLFTTGAVANIMVLEMQIAALVTPTPVVRTAVGVASYNDTHFAQDAPSGMISLLGTAVATTYTSDSGSATPAAFILNLFGIGESSTTAAGNTVNFLSPRLNTIVVDATANNGTVQTLAAAIIAASAGDIIFVRPGTYTENIIINKNLTFKAFHPSGTAGVGNDILMVGKITLSDANITCTFDGFNHQTNSDVIGDVTGNTSRLTFNDCNITCTDNDGFNLVGDVTSNMFFYDCFIQVDNTFMLANVSGGGTMQMYNSVVTRSGTPVDSTISNGSFIGRYSVFEVPFASSTANGRLDFSYCKFGTSITPYINVTWMTIVGTQTQHVANHCEFNSGTAVAITIAAGSILNISNSVITCTNANSLTGAGTVQYSPLTFTDTSETMTVTTQTPLAIGPRIELTGGCQIISGAGSPNTVITAPQGSLFLRTNGTGVADRAFINTDGATAWTALSTVA